MERLRGGGRREVSFSEFFFGLGVVMGEEGRKMVFGGERRCLATAIGE